MFKRSTKVNKKVKYVNVTFSQLDLYVQQKYTYFIFCSILDAFNVNLFSAG